MPVNRTYIYDTIVSAMLDNLGDSIVSDEQIEAIDRLATAITEPIADEIEAYIGGGGITWRGSYNPATAYVPNDAVFYNGSSYVCIANTTGNLPTDTAYWNLFAQAGGTGDDGVGIASSSYNAGTGILTLTFTNGSTFSTGDLRGTDGDDGVGVASTSYNSGTGVLTLTYTNGATFSTGDLRGANGVGIASTSYNAGTGVLTITYTSGATFSTGDLRGAAGRGISSSSYNAATGVLTLTFTDSTTFSTGDLRGDAGSDSGITITTGSATNAANVEILLPDGYSRHDIILNSVIAQTSNSELWARVGVGSPPSFQVGSSDYSHYRYGGAPGSAITGAGASTDTKIVIIGAAMPTGSSGRILSGVFEVFDPDDNTYHKNFTFRVSCKFSSGAFNGISGHGAYNNNSVLTAIRIQCSSGNISLKYTIKSYP